MQVNAHINSEWPCPQCIRRYHVVAMTSECRDEEEAMICCLCSLQDNLHLNIGNHQKSCIHAQPHRLKSSSQDGSSYLLRFERRLLWFCLGSVEPRPPQKHIKPHEGRRKMGRARRTNEPCHVGEVSPSQKMSHKTCCYAPAETSCTQRIPRHSTS